MDQVEIVNVNVNVNMNNDTVIEEANGRELESVAIDIGQFFE